MITTALLALYLLAGILLFLLRKRDRIVQQRFNKFILNLTLDLELKAREREKQQTLTAGSV